MQKTLSKYNGTIIFHLNSAVHHAKNHSFDFSTAYETQDALTRAWDTITALEEKTQNDFGSLYNRLDDARHAINDWIDAENDEEDYDEEHENSCRWAVIDVLQMTIVKFELNDPADTCD